MRYVIANWKQNKSYDDIDPWTVKFLELIKNISLEKVITVVCPPFPLLEKTMQSLPGFALGVQDISEHDDGAHTGFVGIHQISKFCRYAIVGHSERRENRELVMQKAAKCTSSGITPIVCFKFPGEYQPVDGAIYALEDPDNISFGGQYRPKSVTEISSLIATAKKVFPPDAPIVYGGSVNADNAGALTLLEDLSGVLVGNASLDAVNFSEIVRLFSI